MTPVNEDIVEVWRDEDRVLHAMCNLTLRDVFAAFALADRTPWQSSAATPQSTARQAFKLADAMLAERLKDGAA